jgi:hypothetical protein
MLKKITTGFVIQMYDTEKRMFVHQEFIAGQPVDFENEAGEAVDPSLFKDEDNTEAYLPFNMEQPKENPADLREMEIERQVYGRDDITERIAKQVDGMNGKELIEFCQANFGGKNHKYEEDEVSWELE